MHWVSQNSVFIATSMDGFIADKNDELDWLQNTVPNPDQQDMGYEGFMSEMDAIVMGRNTFEKVLSFGIPWPYVKPVFVLTTGNTKAPPKLKDKVQMLSGDVSDILDAIHEKGFYRLYIDGGVTIQQFLEADKIDTLTITVMPILLGGGVRLFGDLTNPLKFELLRYDVFLDEIVQATYRRKR